MGLRLKKLPICKSSINIYENSKIILGYTEKTLSLADLKDFFVGFEITTLKQIHSNIILFAGDIKDGTEGDGIILDQRKKIAVIKTADCVPMIFWNKKYSCAGIIHAGWRGLLKGIEKRLLSILEKESFVTEELMFFFGPSIEKKCYEVGQELYDLFSDKSYREEVFSPKKNCSYLMDIKKGLTLSLIESGVPEKNIFDSNICTFCESQNLPSNRRSSNTRERIYNFIALK